jgi:hypothetical protein
MSVFDDSPSSRARNRCPFDCPPLQKNPMDTELAQAQWTREERLLSIHLDDDDRARYWCDENEEEYLDALFNVI